MRILEYLRTRHWRAVAVLVGLLGSLAFALWYMVLGATPDGRCHGRIVDLHAVDATTAVVLWETQAHSRVGLIDAAGHTRWSREIPGYAQYRDAIQIAGAVAVIRYSHTPTEDDLAVVAVSLQTGELLWGRGLAAGRVSIPAGPSAAAAGRVVEWVERDTEAFAIAFDATTGQIAWKRSIAPHLTHPFMIGQRAIRSDGDDVVVLDVETGTKAERSMNGSGCVIGNNYVNLVFDKVSQRHDLSVFPGADLSSSHALAAEYPGVWLVSCGGYRGSWIAAVYREHLRSESRVLVMDEHGAIARMIAMPDGLDGAREMLMHHPDRASLSGELTRFVPYITDREPRELLMLDLEVGTIAWRRPAEPADVFREADDWFIAEGRYGKSIVTRCDGTAGHCKTVVADDVGIALLAPEHVAAGRMWLYSPNIDTPIDEPEVTVVDVATLKTISSRSIQLVPYETRNVATPGPVKAPR